MGTAPRKGGTKRDLGRMPDLPAGGSERASQKKWCLQLRWCEEKGLPWQEMGREVGQVLLWERK